MKTAKTTTEQPKRVSKTWLAMQQNTGGLIINDPDILKDTIHLEYMKRTHLTPEETPKKISKTWEVAMKLRGHLTVNDPKFLL